MAKPRISNYQPKSREANFNEDRSLRDDHFRRLTEAFIECVKNPQPNLTRTSGTIIRKDKPEIIELQALPVIIFPTEDINGVRNGQQIYWTGI